jgi:hypothetical protein
MRVFLFFSCLYALAWRAGHEQDTAIQTAVRLALHEQEKKQLFSCVLCLEVIAGIPIQCCCTGLHHACGPCTTRALDLKTTTRMAQRRSGMPFVFLAYDSRQEEDENGSSVCQGAMTRHNIIQWFEEGFSCFVRYPGVTLGTAVVCCHDGCEQTCQLRNEWLPHILNCDKRPRGRVQCRYCVEELKQEDVETHLLTACVELPCLVHLCSYTGSWHDIQQHIVQHRFQMFVLLPYRVRMCSLLARLHSATAARCQTILEDIAMDTKCLQESSLDPILAALEGAEEIGVDYHLDGFVTESEGDDEPSESE